jgi:TRAP-type transport system small permease protein
MIWLQKVAGALYRVVFWASVALLASLILLLFAQVLMRYVLSSSFPWIEELSRFLFVWLMFLGIGAGVYNQRHLAITFFVNQFPPRCRQIARGVQTVLMIAFFATLAYLGTVYTVQNFHAMSVMLNLELGYVYAILPATCLCDAIFCVAPRDVSQGAIHE